jgi:hypothetical protein
MMLYDYVSGYLDKPAGELTIEQIQKLLEFRMTEEKSKRMLGFVPDKNSYEWRRGYDDAVADRAWSNEGREYSDEDMWNYGAGSSATTSEKGLKKIGL